MNKFKVIDPKTGEYPDLLNIILNENWAKETLVYCDINGFAITEDGTLILMDECGNYAYPPSDRFEVLFLDNPCDVLRTTYETPNSCPYCMSHLAQDWNFCPECGSWIAQNK